MAKQNHDYLEVFVPGAIEEGYEDYRESIGRPRKGIENLETSLPFEYFKAGIIWALKSEEEADEEINEMLDETEGLDCL